MARMAGIVGSMVMGVVVAIASYFILLPLLALFMPWKQRIAFFGELIPWISTKLDVVLYHAFPFHLGT